MGNKNSTYDGLMQETKDILMEKTGKTIYFPCLVRMCLTQILSSNDK